MEVGDCTGPGVGNEGVVVEVEFAILVADRGDAARAGCTPASRLAFGSGIPTGIAPLPRYYGLIRLLLSLSLFAVLPSPLAELSKHAATFAPPRPLTPKSSRCGGVGFTHTETLTTRK